MARESEKKTRRAFEEFWGKGVVFVTILKKIEKINRVIDQHCLCGVLWVKEE